MRRMPAVCLIVATAFLMGANTKKPQTDSDKQQIIGKWEVVSVQRDGKPQHGQVGREKGDVITIRLNDFGKLRIT